MKFGAYVWQLDREKLCSFICLLKQKLGMI